jgi:hypothetical protein
MVGYIVVYKSTWTANFVVSPKSPKSIKRLQEEQQKIFLEEKEEKGPVMKFKLEDDN